APPPDLPAAALLDPGHRRGAAAHGSDGGGRAPGGQAGAARARPCSGRGGHRAGPRPTRAQRHGRDRPGRDAAGGRCDTAADRADRRDRLPRRPGGAARGPRPPCRAGGDRARCRPRPARHGAGRPARPPAPGAVRRDRLAAQAGTVLDAALARPATELAARHVAAHRELWDRTAVRLVPSHAEEIEVVPLLARTAADGDSRLLAQLAAAYGRYLLISS